MTEQKMIDADFFLRLVEANPNLLRDEEVEINERYPGRFCTETRKIKTIKNVGKDILEQVMTTKIKYGKERASTYLESILENE